MAWSRNFFPRRNFAPPFCMRFLEGVEVVVVIVSVLQLEEARATSSHSRFNNQEDETKDSGNRTFVQFAILEIMGDATLVCVGSQAVEYSFNRG